MIVLADCNNFYVSCERLFNPKAEKRPMIVLSSNDGCVIARSNEAKALGILMGEPYFKIKKLCSQQNVIVQSSNFELYGDISERVMQTLSSFTPEIEVYSIDEAFLYFSDQEDFFAISLALKKRIQKWIGISISVGIGPTKTLAKVASHLAKKDLHQGVFDLSNIEVKKKVLSTFPIKEVWGFGKRLSEKAYMMGANTALDFLLLKQSIVKRKMGVIGERIQLELQGIRVSDFKEEEPKKSITCSRSFGKIVTSYSELSEALSTFVVSSANRLQKQRSVTSGLIVYVESVEEKARAYQSLIAHLEMPTNYTPSLIARAKSCLKRLFVAGKGYKKCGVILLDLLQEDALPLDLFEKAPKKKQESIMNTFALINAHFGKGSLFFGAEGVNPTWKSASSTRSNRFTTNWDELPIAKTD